MTTLGAEYDIVVPNLPLPGWLAAVAVLVALGGVITALVLAFVVWRRTRRGAPPPLPRR